MPKRNMSKHACKCDPHEICEECPEWIFTLADLIMCMMGLFVVLWVLKPDGNPGDPMTKAQEERQIEVIAGIRDAFGYQPDPGSTDPIDLAVMRQQISTGRLAGPQNKGVVKQKIDGATGSDPEVTSVRTGPKAVVGGRVLFEPGNSDLTADGERSLDQIAERIRGHRNVVMVKGHAALDDVADPELDKTALMNLSVRRAQAAADYLVTKGVEPEVLRVQGAGPFEPVVRRAYTPAAMANNRRVEVEATATRVEELQDSRGTGGAPAPR